MKSLLRVAERNTGPSLRETSAVSDDSDPKAPVEPGSDGDAAAGVVD